jgi:ERCC4-type nuclease
MPLHTSTIYVDTRESSHTHSTGPHAGRTLGTDYLPLLLSHRDHPTAESRPLNAGDFCFSGHGPKGPCLIGIERKSVKDMLNSMRTGRFDGEQLPKLLDHYEFTYLLVEGHYRTNWRTGMLETHGKDGWWTLTLGQSEFLGLELESFLNTVTIRTPVRVVRTHDERGTVEMVLALHHWWSTPWSDHRDTMGLYSPDPAQLVSLSKASTIRRVANQLTGVGWNKSAAVEGAFKSVAEMIVHTDDTGQPTEFVTAKEWAKLPGIGKTMSTRIWKELHGEYTE